MRFAIITMKKGEGKKGKKKKNITMIIGIIMILAMTITGST